MDQQANKKISSDICFIMDEDFASFLSEDYLNYTDCLIGPDVNFANVNQHEPDDDRLPTQPTGLMMKESTDQIYFPVKSPWHESDSGVSEVLSFIGSPSDQKLPAQQNIGEVFEQHFLSTLIPCTGTSDELKPSLHDDSYCKIEQSLSFKIMQEEHVECFSSSSVPEQSFHRGSKRKCDFSDNDDYNSDEHIQMVTKPVTVHPQKTEMSSHRCPSNVINVVKIVKPSECTSDATTQDIMKALDERSKKNARQAKINREKKKIYIKKLEDDCESLLKDNSKLSLQVERITKKMLSLEAEVEYLKSVLANASALSGLLKNISNIKEVKLSASLTNAGSRRENDHSYIGKEAHDINENAGICLHVSSGEACLEFCAHCSSLAQKTHKLYDKL